MLFASFVVEQNAFLQSIVHDLIRDLRADFFALAVAGQSGRDFKHVVGTAGVAAGVGRDLFQHVITCLQLKCS